MLNSSRWNYCYIFLNFRAIVLVDSKCSLVTAHIILHIERPDSDSVEIVGVPQNLFAFGFCLWLLPLAFNYQVRMPRYFGNSPARIPSV